MILKQKKNVKKNVNALFSKLWKITINVYKLSYIDYVRRKNKVLKESTFYKERVNFLRRIVKWSNKHGRFAVISIRQLRFLPQFQHMYPLLLNKSTTHQAIGSFIASPEMDWSYGSCVRGLKCQNNTRVSTEAIHHESTYITLFLTRHDESINDDKTTIFTYHLRVSLARFLSADDVTIDCWWRHIDQTIVTPSRE